VVFIGRTEVKCLENYCCERQRDAALLEEFWRRGPGSNRRKTVLQTAALTTPPPRHTRPDLADAPSFCNNPAWNACKKRHMLADMADKPDDPHDVPAATVVLPAPDEAAQKRAKPLFDRFVAQLREQPGGARGSDWEPVAPVEAAPAVAASALVASAGACFAGGRRYDLALSLLPQLPPGASTSHPPQGPGELDAQAPSAAARPSTAAASAALAPALPGQPAAAARPQRTRPGLPAQYGGIRPLREGLLPEPESLEAAEAGNTLPQGTVLFQTGGAPLQRTAVSGAPHQQASEHRQAAGFDAPLPRAPVLLEGDETVGMERASLPPLLPRPPVGMPALRAPVRRAVVLQPDAEALLSQTAETALLRTEDDGAMSFDVAFVDDVFVDLACTVSVHRGCATATFRVRDDNARRLLQAEAGRLRAGLEARGLKVKEVRVLQG
jgi:hypothetical protein